jgi:Lrp/AsnC family leucine-responsive transcriptional regulator
VIAGNAIGGCVASDILGGTVMKHQDDTDTPAYKRLDLIDWKILAALQENARIANVELAEKINLSPSPCLARVRALEQNGFIRSYVTLLDPRSIGLGVNIFIQVRLEKQSESALTTFEKAVAVRPEIMECYLMTGSTDYLLRVVVPDLDAYQKLIMEFVGKIPGVANIQSSVAFKQVKYKTALPLPEGPSIL